MEYGYVIFKDGTIEPITHAMYLNGGAIVFHINDRPIYYMWNDITKEFYRYEGSGDLFVNMASAATKSSLDRVVNGFKVIDTISSFNMHRFYRKKGDE